MRGRVERGGREEAEGLMTKGRGYYYDRGSGEEGVGVAGGREGGEVVTEVVIAETELQPVSRLGVVEEDH